MGPGRMWSHREAFARHLWLTGQSVHDLQCLGIKIVSTSSPQLYYNFGSTIIVSIALRPFVLAISAEAAQNFPTSLLKRSIYEYQLYDTMQSLVPAHRLLDAPRECFNLTSWRLCSRGVSGCLSSEFGGPLNSAYQPQHHHHADSSSRNRINSH